MYSKTFRDYNQLSNTLDKWIVQPTLKGVGLLTEFDPPVDYYTEHKKEYATMIFFTDGEAPLPRKKPSGMVWVISSIGYHQDYPGKVIYIPKDNNNK